MFRKTLTILSLIGLLLSAALWGVSYWGIAYDAQTGAFGSVSYGSVIIGNHGVPIPVDATGWRGFGSFDFSFYTVTWWPFAYRYSNPPTGWEAGMPLWIPTVVFGFVAARLCWPVFDRRKRRKLGLCVACGYDLRGSAERCPECGTTF